MKIGIHFMKLTRMYEQLSKHYFFVAVFVFSVLLLLSRWHHFLLFVFQFQRKHFINFYCFKLVGNGCVKEGDATLYARWTKWFNVSNGALIGKCEWKSVASAKPSEFGKYHGIMTVTAAAATTLQK